MLTLDRRPFGVRYVVRGEETLDGVRCAVGMHNADARVPRRATVELREQPEEVRQEDAIHSPVADDKDRLAWILAREALDRAEGAREDLIERLTTRPCDEAVVVPVRQASRLIECL